MKVLFILGLLLPFGVIASPEAIPEVPVESLAERSAGPEPAEELFRRAVTCQIIGNDGPVACRTRPSTTGDLVARLPVGNYYSFTCYARGTSVGGNTAWDRVYSGCYVSAFYTSSACTTTTLPPC